MKIIKDYWPLILFVFGITATAAVTVDNVKTNKANVIVNQSGITSNQKEIILCKEAHTEALEKSLEQDKEFIKAIEKATQLTKDIKESQIHTKDMIKKLIEQIQVQKKAGKQNLTRGNRHVQLISHPNG